MTSMTFLLQVVAVVAFFMAAFGVLPTARVAWGWLGLLAWLLSLMIGGFSLHVAR